MGDPCFHHNKIEPEQERGEDREGQVLGTEDQGPSLSR